MPSANADNHFSEIDRRKLDSRSLHNSAKEEEVEEVQNKLREN
jgi:hypothetical protein